ncbi:MAG: N-acetylneuraminate synthase family protein, partial [Candidatus Omnitrophica bacterium]|nr:N-acetylneuraminate synthase family protein [Candidatus Omnitrophota bacterium]
MDLKKDLFQNLFIFEMANNHMGSLKQALEIVKEIRKVTQGFDFNFAFKLQYRDLDTFIHPDFKNNFEFKYVKRFSETRLKPQEFKALKDQISSLGFISICTPFDEPSVDLIEEHAFQIIKIGSCSITDWPLLERVAKADKPIILSTAGISLEDLDKVVSFLSHRNKLFSIMHCVAQYPTDSKNLQLNQIDLLKKRYPKIAVGYSTHELPDIVSAVKIAIGKGASLFEKHVGLEVDGSFPNSYSANPQQVKLWLEAAREALEICGVKNKRAKFSPEELTALKSLRRGVFAKKNIAKGERVESVNTFLAIPTQEGQITANDMSKYTEYCVKQEIKINQPVILANLQRVDNREKIYEIVQKVKNFLKASKVSVPGELDLEISHHYGVDKFYEYGGTIINVVNRQYCKKLIVIFPGQKH